jgi:opacity protein-like surface antigen
MKRFFLSVIAVIIFGVVNAQDVKYGIKGGLNVSNFSGDTDGVDLKSRLGLNIGAFVEVKLSDKFSIQPEVLYSQQGAKLVITGNFNDGYNITSYKAADKENLAYINVPVMFKYYAIEKFSIEFGPQIGFLVSEKAKIKAEGITIEESDTEYYKKGDFGLNFGAGYDFTESIFVGARYNLGLTNIGTTAPGNDGKNHNGVFSLSLGYKFK